MKREDILKLLPFHISVESLASKYSLILLILGSMRTDKDLLVKGIKSFLYTALTMFIAPIVLYQAFKNTDKPLFIPVLIIGLLLAGVAIYMGFRSVNIVMDAVFGKKKKRET